jgi:hypothetical protein
LLVALAAAWIYWNWPRRTDLSRYAPADSLAYLEVNDLAALTNGIEQTQAWQALAPPIGAPAKLSPNRFWTTLARWTGIGYIDAILFARTQVAVVFSGAEGNQTGSTLTIKPLTTFIIETHTSQRRMKPAVERHLEELARRVYKDPVFVRKRIQNTEFEEWTSPDGTHQIVFAFIETAAIVGNDETSVMHSMQARMGSIGSLSQIAEFTAAHDRTQTPTAAVFGFISQPGIKSFLQAYALYRSGSSPDAAAGARIFADTFGGLVKHVGWSASFRDQFVEDRCSIALVDGAADKIRTSIQPERGPDFSNLPFIPPDAYSFSLYRLHDAAGFWSDFNAAVSAHTDVLGSIAARPMLKSVLKSYGIDDPDLFARAVGTRLQTVRFEENGAAVLVADAFDPPQLRKLALRRLGKDARHEAIGDAELLVSAAGDWASAFAENSFLTGPADLVRRCLSAHAEKQSMSSAEAFRKSQANIDVSLPIVALTFTKDQRAAISFVEAFSQQPRSAFAGTGDEIDRATKALPLAVSASILRESNLEWTSRSSFGIGGALTAQMFPESH